MSVKSSKKKQVRKSIKHIVRQALGNLQVSIATKIATLYLKINNGCGALIMDVAHRIVFSLN